MKSSLLRRWSATGVAGALAMSGSVLLTAPAQAAAPAECAEGTCTVTYDYTGDLQDFVVPVGITVLEVTVNGAQGGTATNFQQPGGEGGTTTASIVAPPGAVLKVMAGARGQDAFGSGSNAYGGGGAARPGSYLGSGGGGSYLFTAAGTLILAAGGGGGGGAYYTEANDPGGAGSGAGLDGGAGGVSGFYAPSEVGAGGGTPTGPGSAGLSLIGNGFDGSGPAGDFAPGYGGNGNDYDNVYGGAGGGGGYYGGGGGAYPSAGGGGSGYAGPVASDISATVGGHTGNGSIVISWHQAAVELTLSVSPVGSTVVGSAVGFSSTVIGELGTVTGTLTFAADGTALPDCTAVPLVDGSASCSTTTLPVGANAITAVYSGSFTYAPATSDAVDHQVDYPPVVVTSSALPGATVGEAYTATLSATGGLAPYAWTASALPDGLTLGADGTITGTPTQAGIADLTVGVSDSQATPATSEATLELTTVRGSQTVSIDSAAPSDVAVGDTYEPVTSGGPSGNPVTIAVSGVCSSANGVVTFLDTGDCVITASQAGNDDYTAADTDDQTVTVTAAPLVLAPDNDDDVLPQATVGAPYSYTFTATGGTAPYTFSSDDLPAGLTLDGETGVLSGTLTDPAALSFTVSVTDSRATTPPLVRLQAAVFDADGQRVIGRAFTLQVSAAEVTTTTTTTDTTTTTTTDSSTDPATTTSDVSTTDETTSDDSTVADAGDQVTTTSGTTSGLAYTGVSIGNGLLVALLALLAGGGLLLAARPRAGRRRH